MAKPRFRKLSKKEAKASLKKPQFVERERDEAIPKPVAEKRKIALPEVVSVKEFAELAGIPVTNIIAELMKNGVLANINQTIDFDTAAIIGDDLNLEIIREEQHEEAESTKKEEEEEDSGKLAPRPPVVAIMGHVDHGKTSLLDFIKKSHVAESESGGITQHITAYQVTLEHLKNENLKHRTITFIDTPGHAAFSAIREHGAAITDIAVIIVAANDGVKPQTVEVIKAAKASNVPIIIAINKVDLPDADVMKTKQQLAEYDLVPEEWGGKTVMVEISAKTGQHVDELLEMILLQADLMDLKANPDTNAVGVVIEAQMQKGTGAVARVLIENGTLIKGDPIAIGGSYGKVRILENFAKKSIECAGPGTPVRVAGLKSVPNFGDKLIVFNSEKEAKEAAGKAELATTALHIATARRMTKGDEEDGAKGKELKVVIKADAKGSLEAIKKSLSEIASKEVILAIISEGIGPIAESDVTLAKAVGGIVAGFRVKILGAAKKIAETEKVLVKTYDVIYQFVDEVRALMSDLLPPEIIEEELGSGPVLAIFRDDKKGFVAGGRVEKGRIMLGDKIKFLQNDKEKYRAAVLSLRKEKGEAKEVKSGSECGFGLSPFAKVAVGDSWITFKTIERKRTL